LAKDVSGENSSRLFALVCGVVIIVALHYAKVVFVPLALAMLFAFVLTPLVSLLERARLGRTVATLLVILVALGAVGTVGWGIANQFADVINQLPYYQSNIEEKINSLHVSNSSTLKNATATINEIDRALIAQPQHPEPEPAPRNVKNKATDRKDPVPVQVVSAPALPLESVQNALELLLQALIVIVFTAFMLLQRENLRNRFISLVGQRQLSTMTCAIDEASDRVSRYLRTQLAVNTTYGVCIGIALHFIGIPGALLWGAVAGIMRFLPYVGPPLGGIMPVILSMALFHGWRVPLITFGLFFCVEVVMAHAIEPLIYGAHTGISSLAILVAAIFWTVIWGPIGLVLSTPLTVCIVVLGHYVPQLSFIPILLGGNPDLPMDVLVYQRMLAGDQDEIEQILENLLVQQPLVEVYDSVLISALNMAEHDRHSGQIDENMISSLLQTAREIISDTYDRAKDLRKSDNGAQASNTAPLKIVCVPARDEADEIVAIMLSQVLCDAGMNAVYLRQAPTAELVQQIQKELPDLICISALPPFVISHSRMLCRQLKAASTVPIAIGLWKFAGDTAKLASRLNSCAGSEIFTTLSGAVEGLAHRGVEAKSLQRVGELWHAGEPVRYQ
jgi:predicted PurR-regulated permease PerM/methanogenic corrinoid protein MtbC1